MIAVLRIRFDTNNNPATVWSDSLFENWLHPAIPFSLGNFWWESAWGFIDLQYQLFPEFVMTDPRPSVVLAPGEPPDFLNSKKRAALVTGALQQATSQFAPFWEQFDVVLLWFAQQTDMFGGGSYPVTLRDGSTKQIKTTVVDLASPFDGACQELGHGFGLDHEIDAGGNEYASPYSVMSARDNSVEFLRPADLRLPDGSPITDSKDKFFNLPAQRVIGPALPAAQLYNYPWFQDPPRVVQVPADHVRTVKLYALDHARALSQSALLPVLAIIPPKWVTGRTFAVELRRGGHRYDQAIGSAGGPPAGLVVHSFNPDGRVRYEGVLPIVSAAGDLDWSSTGGIFTLRLLELGPDNEFARFQVVVGAFQAQRNVDLNEGSRQVTETPGDVREVMFDEPCVKGTFKYQEKRRAYDLTFFATSYGFEKPEYRWYLDGTRLTEDGATPGAAFQMVTLNPEVTIPTPATSTSPAGAVTKTTAVKLSYLLTGNRLRLLAGTEPGNFTCTLRVVAYADPALDPFEVSAERYLSFQCVRFDWEKAYYDKLDHCYAWVNDIVHVPGVHIHVDPGDPLSYQVRPEELAQLLRYERALHFLQKKHPARAQEFP